MILILATTPSGGIGYRNRLPWTKLVGDLPRFKKLTDGKVVVMGRNTWESLPSKPLNNRLNFVVTSDHSSINGAIPISNLDYFKNYSEACIIGGAQLINSCWGNITKIYLTRTLSEYTSDKFIDLQYITDNFVMLSEEIHSDHLYQIWERT